MFICGFPGPNANNSQAPQFANVEEAPAFCRVARVIHRKKVALSRSPLKFFAALMAVRLAQRNTQTTKLNSLKSKRSRENNFKLTER